MFITSEGYANLSDCAKFVLNGCLSDVGVRDEPNCGPIRKWEHWEEYQGLASQRECDTSECLCKPPKFDASFAVAYDAGERYCGMRLSTEALPNEEYDDMQNVFAMYCASEGYPPKDWFLTLVGQPPGSNESISGSNQTERNDGKGFFID